MQLSSLENARQAVEQEAAWYDSSERLNSLKLLRAIRLAPTLDICEAILRREPVPRSALDPQWAKAYRL